MKRIWVSTEIAQAELFLEGGAAAVDLGFGAIDGSRHVVSGVRSERRAEGTERQRSRSQTEERRERRRNGEEEALANPIGSCSRRA